MVREPESDMFDLEKAVEKWAFDVFSMTASSELKKMLSRYEIELKFIWDDIISAHDPPEFIEDQRSFNPKGQALFSTTFKNVTDVNQEYTCHTERRTTSVAEIEIEEGVLTTKELGIKLAVSLIVQLFEALIIEISI
ncbi:unnamed protein product [Protopolystoma xenopodis]|uniref:Uncharacterized protein n=1 Tax=Protopolystoma xenopodis TaxID=117903 RepID=A0A448WM60_9PLAT|nr:unnamed protein product [Protopolystoma xenopodis]